MQNGERLSLEQIRAFLEARGDIEFDAASRREVYDWVTGALCEQILSGPATRKILYREFHDYGGQRYERLAAISVAHIYNLRKRRAYREKRIFYQKTRPVHVAIGDRRRRQLRPRKMPTVCLQALTSKGDFGACRKGARNLRQCALVCGDAAPQDSAEWKTTYFQAHCSK